MRLLKAAFFSLGLLALPAFSQQNSQTQSSTDIQSVQSRSYSKPYKTVYKSILTVFFDNKFRVSFTDMNSGVIIAVGTPSVSENIGANVAFIPFVGGLLASQRQTAVEQWQIVAQVDELDNKEVQVRIGIVAQTRRAGMNVSAADSVSVSDLTDKPEIYQGIFSGIEKAIFVRENIK
jgi:hypothetical protein